MIRPNFFTDVRQFQPNVDQNGLTMAGFDQPAEVFIVGRIGLVIMPTGNV